MNLLVLVVDNEPDVELLFRQQFRHDLRAGRFTMEFAQSGPAALQCIADAAGVSIILILSDINMPGMSGLELAAQGQSRAAGCSNYHDYGLWRCRDKAEGTREWRRGAFHQAHRLRRTSQRNRHVRRTDRMTYRTNPTQ
jgi:hypothetical protein